MSAIDYLNPKIPSGLARVAMPIVDATPAALDGYGRLVDDPETCHIEIVRWPSLGTRPVDDGTGDQGGTTEGVFVRERTRMSRRVPSAKARKSWLSDSSLSFIHTTIRLYVSVGRSPVQGLLPAPEATQMTMGLTSST